MKKLESNRILNLAVVFSIFLLIALQAVQTYANASSENWSFWRGPDGTGVAKNSNPPLTWSETENIKWKVKLPGEGQSTPVIWGDKIFFLTAIDTGETGDQNSQRSMGGNRPTTIHKFDIVCMDRNNGNILWQKTAREEVPHEGHNQDGSFAPYSPVTDGNCVWASFGSHGVYCYDMDGNPKWSRDLGQMTILSSFGEGSSAALAGNALIVVKDHEGDSFIYALDKDTGDILWQKSRDEGTSWSTPLALEFDGRLQVVTSAPNFVRCYDVQTGELLWQCSGQAFRVCSVPVSGFDMVFCTSGFRGSALQAIKLGSTGDISGTDAISWEINRDTPDISSPLLYDDKIYVCSGNQPIISCYQAETGKSVFVAQRLPEINQIYASPVGAGERIYFVGRNGITQVISLSDQLEVLATNKLDDIFSASPVIVGNQLFLKGMEYFYCIEASLQ